MTVCLKLRDNSLKEEAEHVSKAYDIEALRHLITNDRSLNVRTDDTFLLSCLRARKFDCQKAFKLLKKYYSVRKEYPDIFQNFYPSSVEKCLQAGMMGYLPYTDHEGHGIAIGRTSHWNPHEIKAEEIMRAMMMMGDFALNNDLVQKHGCIVILDTSNASLRHALQVTPVLAYRFASIMLGAYPLRYKAIHVLNASAMVRGLIATLVRPLLPPKIKKRIHIHPNLESLHRFVPPKYLPSDFGGEMPPFDATIFYDCIRRHETFFRQNEKYWRHENH